jgi:hypothetical protein
LSVGAQPADADLEREPNNSPAQASAFSIVPPTMRGFIAPKGDVDWFKFTVPPGRSKASVETNGPFPLKTRITDENKLPVGPAPLQAGRTYFVSVEAQSDKSSNAKDPYTVTLRLE